LGDRQGKSKSGRMGEEYGGGGKTWQAGDYNLWRCGTCIIIAGGLWSMIQAETEQKGGEKAEIW